MPKTYTVQPGDTLTKIAAREGFPSWRELYYHPDNEAFRRKRPNPDRIFPGDVLAIPSRDAVAPPPNPDESTAFKLFLMANFDFSHRPRALIFPPGAGKKAVSSYTFQPAPFEQVLERRLAFPKGERNTVVDFHTPEPVATHAFEGPVALLQFIFTRHATICKFSFRALGRSGTEHLITVDLATEPSDVQGAAGFMKLAHTAPGASATLARTARFR